jgi:uncharacterized DUF497 family protein
MHADSMEIEFDSSKATVNLKKHGVSFQEAATCLLDPVALVMEDRDAECEQRFVLVGMSSETQLITVCYTLRGETIRIISARKTTKKEGGQYAQGI